MLDMENIKKTYKKLEKLNPSMQGSTNVARLFIDYLSQSNRPNPNKYIIRVIVECLAKCETNLHPLTHKRAEDKRY